MKLVAVALTVALWAAAIWRFGLTWELPAYLYLATITVPLAVIDLRTLRLPNTWTLPAYPIVAVLLLLPAVADGSWGSYGRAALAGVVLLALYLLLHVINPAGMGLGDVKLAGPLGALLGWLSWNAVLWGAMLGFVLGAGAGLLLMALRRAGRRSELPFGPAMLAGAWLAILAMPIPT